MRKTVKISKQEQERTGIRKISKVIDLYQLLVDWYIRLYGDQEEIEDAEDFFSFESAGEYLQEIIRRCDEKDFDNIQFDTENIQFDSDEMDDWNASEFIGFNKLPNGIEFLGVEVCGDWEGPMYLIIYHDGQYLRGYIPVNGNTYNTDYNTAFGSEDSSLKKNCPPCDDNPVVKWLQNHDYIPVNPDDKDSNYMLEPDYELMLKDVENHLVLEA